MMKGRDLLAILTTCSAMAGCGGLHERVIDDYDADIPSDSAPLADAYDGGIDGDSDSDVDTLPDSDAAGDADLYVPDTDISDSDIDSPSCELPEPCDGPDFEIPIALGQNIDDVLMARPEHSPWVTAEDLPCVLQDEVYTDARGLPVVAEQALRFDRSASDMRHSMLVHERNEDDVEGTFMRFVEDELVYEFRTRFNAEGHTGGFWTERDSDGHLAGVRGLDLNILGDSYRVVIARQNLGTRDIFMRLYRNLANLSIYDGSTVNVSRAVFNGSEHECRDYEISVTVDGIGAYSGAYLDVNGEHMYLRAGESHVLPDGNSIYLADVGEHPSGRRIAGVMIYDRKLDLDYLWEPDEGPIYMNNELVDGARIRFDYVSENSDGLFQLDGLVIKLHTDGARDRYPYVASDECLSLHLDNPESMLGLDICHDEDEDGEHSVRLTYRDN